MHPGPKFDPKTPSIGAIGFNTLEKHGKHLSQALGQIRVALKWLSGKFTTGCNITRFELLQCTQDPDLTLERHQ